MPSDIEIKINKLKILRKRKMEELIENLDWNYFQPELDKIKEECKLNGHGHIVIERRIAYIAYVCNDCGEILVREYFKHIDRSMSNDVRSDE